MMSMNEGKFDCFVFFKTGVHEWNKKQGLINFLLLDKKYVENLRILRHFLNSKKYLKLYLRTNSLVPALYGEGV